MQFLFKSDLALWVQNGQYYVLKACVISTLFTGMRFLFKSDLALWVQNSQYYFLKACVLSTFLKAKGSKFRETSITL